ncbi:MAG: DNA-binding protein, partial [Planctomycetaceae bacterium]|nr:DNA-binding protein [Planctomycetaceae bacterium]
GDEELSRRILIDLYLSGHPLATIGDEIIAAAFCSVGELWECGDVEVYEERRACEICLRIVRELRALQEPAPADAPTALGGTLDGDPYTLAVSLAEVVLRDAGFRACSLGHLLPFSTLHAALERCRPRLMWLSVSAVRDEPQFIAHVNRLQAAASDQGCAFVIGGRALQPDLRRQLTYGAYCDTFQHLYAFARTLLHAK